MQRKRICGHKEKSFHCSVTEATASEHTAKSRSLHNSGRGVFLSSHARVYVYVWIWGSLGMLLCEQISICESDWAQDGIHRLLQYEVFQVQCLNKAITDESWGASTHKHTHTHRNGSLILSHSHYHLPIHSAVSMFPETSEEPSPVTSNDEEKFRAAQSKGASEAHSWWWRDRMGIWMQREKKRARSDKRRGDVQIEG